MLDGEPVAYASRTLSSAEKYYCLIEKELLAVVFGVRRFDQYLYGLTTNVETDHQLLETIFKKPKRLQRMLLALQSCDLKVSYGKGSELYVADTLSGA